MLYEKRESDKLEKETNPTWEYYKSIIFVIFWIELVLFLIAIIFGRLLGYNFTLITCLWLGIIVAAVFTSIVFANLAVIFFYKAYLKIKKKMERL